MTDPWAQPRPRQGWIWYVCDGPEGCGRAWRETTRDSYSGSTENCTCGEFCRIERSEVDPTVVVDEWANLVEHQVVELAPPRVP